MGAAEGGPEVHLLYIRRALVIQAEHLYIRRSLAVHKASTCLKRSSGSSASLGSMSPKMASGALDMVDRTREATESIIFRDLLDPPCFPSKRM